MPKSTVFFFWERRVLDIREGQRCQNRLFLGKKKLNEKSVPKSTVFPGGGGFRSKSRLLHREHVRRDGVPVRVHRRGKGCTRPSVEMTRTIIGQPIAAHRFSGIVTILREQREDGSSILLATTEKGRLATSRGNTRPTSPGAKPQMPRNRSECVHRVRSATRTRQLQRTSKNTHRRSYSNRPVHFRH